MKRILKTSLVLVLTLSMVLSVCLALPIVVSATDEVCPGNVIINGGAEDDSSNWSSTGEIEIATDDKYSGSKSFAITSKTFNITQSNIPVEPNTKYLFLFAYRSDVDQTLNLKLNGVWKTKFTGTGPIWRTRYYTNFTTASDQYTLTLELYKDGETTDKVGYIDDIRLIKVESEDSLIYNGGAEYVCEGWLPKDNMTLSGEAHTGGYSFKPNSWYYLEQTVNLTAGTDYRFSYYAKSTDNNETFVKICTGTGGSGTELVSLPIKGEYNDWTLFEKFFTSTTDQTVYVFFKYNSSTNYINSNTFIDDISLEALPPETGIIKNAGAERNGEHWQPQDQWQSVITTTDKSHSGIKSFKAPIYNGHNISQDIAVAKNTEYVISYYTLGDDKSLETGWRKSTDGAHTGDVIKNYWNTTTHSDWTKLNYRFNSEENELVEFYFKSCAADIDRYIDDISIRVFADAKEDGKTDLVDLLVLKKAINNEAEVTEALDVDFSGTLTMADRVELGKFLLGK